MSEPGASQRGLNILCIDNGGVQGLSAILLIQETMKRVQKLQGLDFTPEPHQYFDLIVGTGTGAIQACILGRLRIPIHLAIGVYAKLARDINSGLFEMNQLKDSLRNLIRNATGNPDEPMKHEDEGGCKTLVFARARGSLDGSGPIAFRSYTVATNEGPDCTIWETLCATMVHPDLFKHFELGDPPSRQSFINAGMGCHNPLPHALSEARTLYPRQYISSILSIGAGHRHTTPSPKRGYLITLMNNLVTEAEEVAGEVAKRFNSAEGIYFRLNVDQGVDDVEMAESEHLGKIADFTTAYTKQAEVRTRIDQAAQAIRRRRPVVPTEQIDGEIRVETLTHQAMIGCPAPSRNYTDRPERHNIEACISGDDHERKICVVHGLGGAGKTQVALKAIERTYTRWKEIIYVDGTTRETIEGQLEAFAASKSAGNTHLDALNWLESHHEPWILVFDGVNDPSFRIRDFIPEGNHVRVLITTRLRQLVDLAQGSHSECEISSNMHPDQALELILRLVGETPEELSNEENKVLASILKELGYLPLAIVQAGALIEQSSKSYAEYLSLLQTQRKSTLESSARLDNYDKTVYTTWMESYKLLGTQAQELLSLIAFLHCDGITSDIFQRAALNLCVKQHDEKFPPGPLEDSARNRVKKFLSSFLDVDKCWNAPQFLRIIGELLSHSLVTHDHINGSYSIHVLVQDWARTIFPNEFDLATRCTRTLLSASIPPSHDPSSEAVKLRVKLSPHIDEVIPDDFKALEPNHALAFALVYQDMKELEKLKNLQVVFEEAKARLSGETGPETLEPVEELVGTYSKQGRHSGTENLTDQLQNERDRPLGDERSRSFEPTRSSETAHWPSGSTIGKMEGSGSSNAGPSVSGGFGGSQDDPNKTGKGGGTQDRGFTKPHWPTWAETISKEANPKQGLNILCIDGGGVRGLSSLLLLQEAMNRLQKLEGQDISGKPPKPAEWFDVIAGTGTGGVIACLLGRLEMPIEKAIESYVKLTETTFSSKSWTGKHKYEGDSLKKALQSIVEDATGNKDTKLVEDVSKPNGHKTIVFAMLKDNMNASLPVMFRSYLVDAHRAPNCTIWEALYATMAHPDFFKEIKITENSLTCRYVGGELGSSNPLSHVLDEVRELHPCQYASCIMSIGAGHAHTIRIPDSGRHPTSIAMKNMAIDSERVADEMDRRFRDTNGVYFRFNVDQGIQDIEADGWEKLDSVNAHTQAYMRGSEVSRSMHEAVKAIHGREAALAVEYIDGRVRRTVEPAIIKSCPMPTTYYTGRAKEIEGIGNCIVNSTEQQRICVLHGLGGTGKSQLAFKTIEKYHRSWDHIIYVDAASEETIERTLRDFARVKRLGHHFGNHLGNTYADTIQWLEKTSDTWLLVLDGADDVELNIKRYIPNCFHGSILITTRLEARCHLARPDPKASAYRISTMRPKEASDLLLKIAHSQTPLDSESEMETNDADALVRDFEYLALAIVQAGAYIAHSPGMSISNFHTLFLERKQVMLEKYQELPKWCKFDDYDNTVYTTWNMCYKLLKRHEKLAARELLQLIAFLHHNSITRAIFQRAVSNIWDYVPALRRTAIEAEAHTHLFDHFVDRCSTNGTWDESLFMEIIRELTKYSLVEFDRRNMSYSIHVLVQDWARTKFRDDPAIGLERTTSLLSLSIDTKDDLELHHFRIGLAPHVKRILSESEKLSRGAPRPWEVNANHSACFANVFKSMGQWKEEEPLRLKVKNAREEELSREHPATLQSFDDLAHNYKNQARWNDAEKLYTEVLEIRRRTQSEEHDDIQASKKYLASLYQSQGRLTDAEALWVDVIEKYAITKGGNSPESLACTINLADLYLQLGKKEESKRGEHFSKSKDLRQKVLGLTPDGDLNKPLRMRALAEIMELMEEWDAAELQLVRSKATLDILWGNKHLNAIAGQQHLYEFRIRRRSLPPTGMSCPSSTSSRGGKARV